MGEATAESLPHPKLTAWEKLVHEQHVLFAETVQRNMELEQEVMELKRDLAAWKLAFTASSEDKEKMKQHTMSLERSVAEMKDHNSLALALLDGDGCIFSREFVSQGRSGGQRAAAILHRELLSTILDHNVQLYTVVCFNRIGLGDALLANGICTKSDFEDFIIGFNQSAPLFAMIDVGKGKEAADAKIRDMLKLFAHLPQTKRIFFGGAHDGGYASVLTSLQTEGLLDKVSILQGYQRSAYEIDALRMSIVTINGLFMEQKLNLAGAPRKESIEGEKEKSADPLESPLKPVASVYLVPSNADPSQGRRIDHAKPLFKQTKPPCNKYYLLPMGCAYGPVCRFAHDYVFTPQLLVQLRRELKGILCATSRKGICTDRHCIYGHLDMPANRNDVDLDDSSQASFRARNMSPLTVQSDEYNESSIPLAEALPLQFGTATYSYFPQKDSRRVELLESFRNISTMDVSQNPQSPIPQTSEPPPRAFCPIFRSSTTRRVFV
ncbi:hypothetical protein BS47DRAFT_1331293 [Hydnum rufescens UP504]|uniref:C3H1-type domain-containing protein n=1 Tax=Hydnum rufescens UP504 TaxID=1448309 RepID=A0A9P6AS95_9AGAM|nr:hypothetical protein BS47DRAFT_1331293 [Hydnum rufescens UP504]